MVKKHSPEKIGNAESNPQKSHLYILPSFAKINLILHVTGRHADGYHSLETLFQTIELHDELEFRFSKSESFQVILESSESGLANDSSNLIYKACEAFHQAYPVQLKIEVKIKKRIPIGGGLGGGSSNAAVTLVALSRFLDWPLTKDHLIDLGKNLGADAPFFLFGGSAIGSERGDQITQLPDLESADVLLICPAFSCSTAEVYRKFDEQSLLTLRANSIKILPDQRPESLRGLVSQFENDLEKVVFVLYPELDSIKKRLTEQGAIAAALTGSGSAVFGLFDDENSRDKAAEHFPGSIKTRFITKADYQLALGLDECQRTDK